MDETPDHHEQLHLERSLFQREHHRLIGFVLEHIRADLFLENRCLLAGGTAISLAHGEWRQAGDIGFVCDSVDGYRELRSLANSDGLAWAFSAPVKLTRETRFDQFGMRTVVEVAGIPIKFEIAYEGLLVFDKPRDLERICGAWRVTDSDLIATKLMANAERWDLSSEVSRDMIDMAMIAPGGRLARAGVDKAERAYGNSIFDSFRKGKQDLLAQPGRLRECMNSMGMTLAEGDVRSKIDRLAFEKPMQTTAITASRATSRKATP